jgi:hypothetical protein
VFGFIVTDFNIAYDLATASLAHRMDPEAVTVDYRFYSPKPVDFYGFLLSAIRALRIARVIMMPVATSMVAVTGIAIVSEKIGVKGAAIVWTLAWVGPSERYVLRETLSWVDP